MSEAQNTRTSPPEAQQPTITSHLVNGKLVDHRLDQLEERMTEVEKSLKSVELLCTEIKANLQNKASEKYVLLYFVVAIGTSIFTLLGHIGLKAL